MIPFLNLKAQYEQVDKEIVAAVTKVLASTAYVCGKEVAAFEEEFADYVGAKYAIGVNSGTSALHMALLAADIGPGDEVITTAGTFVATVAAIDYAGAKPVFVDIEPNGLNIDASQIEAAITPATKAIMPVHLHGHPADLAPIKEIADRHGLTLIEDAAQAHGAEYRGQRVGAIGDLGCFSFYPGKNLGACGEGGMVVTNSEHLAEQARMLRDWGQSKKYHHVRKGFNYRMDEIQGAALRVKLRRLEGWTEGRREHANSYSELLADTAIQLPMEHNYARHVYHVYGIRTAHRDALQAALGEREIHTGIHYPIPVHLQPAHAELGYSKGDFPRTEQAATELLSLPMFPELTRAQVEEVCAAVKAEVARVQ